MAQPDLQYSIKEALFAAVTSYLKQAEPNAATAAAFASAEQLPLEHPIEAHGDYASPVAFALAKQLKKNPAEVAKAIVEILQSAQDKKFSAIVGSISATGPFINMTLAPEFLQQLPRLITKLGSKYGTSKAGKKETIVIEYSGVNIGKPFSIGHLRSTVNGTAISNLLEATGHKVVRLNYLGDWGTQFGKLIAGFKRWGSADALKATPIEELMRVYVKFHEEAAKDDKLIEEGREWFRKLESGDKEALKLWQEFVDVSLAHAKKIYALLETPFDHMQEGEAQYRKDLPKIMKLLEAKGLLKKSQGATIVDLEAENMPPLLVQKTDEASLYATRELAAAIARQKKYKFSSMLYEVGLEQQLHFKQVFTVLKKLGFEWADQLEHIGHGLYRMGGKKMSTRAGRTSGMYEILLESIERAKKVIASKNPDLKNADEIAQQVGIGAVKYNDLSQNRLHSIDFDFDRMLSLEGNSSPYLQYTHARIQSILRKAKSDEPATTNDKENPEAAQVEQLLVRRLVRYPEVIAAAAQRRMPHLLATELFELASRFNLFYQKVPVLKAQKEQREARVELCKAVAQVLKNGLGLLGIHAPDEM
jgi:arginyl-tRNA synthetase